MGSSIFPQLMEKMDWIYLLVVASSFLSGGAYAEPAQGRGSMPPLYLSPPHLEVVKSVNESYIVSCQAERGIHIMWTTFNSTHSQQITVGKGRIHVEDSRVGRGVNLIFESIERKDKGEYTCSATIDSVEVKEAFRLVVIKPIAFVDTPPVQVAKENQEEFAIRCEVEGDPDPTIVWSRKGKPLNDPRFRSVADGLSITNVSLQDRGEYLCRAFQTSSAAASMKQQIITLVVQHKPRRGGYKGNGFDEEEHKGDSGEASSSQAWGYIGGKVNLTCEAIAEPEADFHWLRGNFTILSDKDTKIIDLKHQSILQLTIHDESAFGDYVCKASNSLGTLERVVVLQKGSRPGAPSAAVKAVTADAIHLDIHPPPSHHHHSGEHEHDHDHHELDIVGYRVQWKRQEEEGWSDASTMDFTKGGQYVISGLSHDTSYLVRVAAKNAAGVGDFAEELHHRTGKITADSVTGESSSAISVHVPPNLLFHLFLQLVMLTVPLVSCRASMSVNL